MSDYQFNAQFNTRQFNGTATSLDPVAPTGNADDIQKYYFEARDKDELLLAVLPNVQNGSMTRVVNEVGSLTFDYPGLDSNCDYLVFPNQVWIYDQRHTLIEKYVILPTKQVMSGVVYTHSVDCASIIYEMTRTHVPTFTTTSTVEVGTLLNTLFQYQAGNNQFSIGYIDYSIRNKEMEFDLKNQNMLQVIESIFSAVNMGYYWVDSSRRFYWLNKQSPTYGHQIRLGKNMIGVTVTSDPTTIVNQVYVYGQDADTKTRIDLGVQNDTTSQALYGIIPAAKELKQCGDLTMLQTYANNYLAIYAYPLMTYDIDCVNLSTAYPELHWFEELQLGSRVKIYNEDLGIETSDIVVKLEDDLSNPIRQKVVLGNLRPTLEEPIQNLIDRIQDEETSDTVGLAGSGSSSTGIDPDSTASVGESEDAARADHQHALEDVYEVVADPEYIQPTGGGSTQGTSKKFARADHGHNLGSDVYSSNLPSEVAPDSTGDDGDSTALSKSDHTHALDDTVTYWDSATNTGNFPAMFADIISSENSIMQGAISTAVSDVLGGDGEISTDLRDAILEAIDEYINIWVPLDTS